MKELLNKHKISLSILYLFAVILTILTSIQVKYTLIAPGYNNNINEFIIIEDGIEETGSFSTTSVIVEYQMPLLQKWFASNLKTVTVYEQPTVYQNTTTKDLNYRSTVMKNDSLSKSVIVAFEYANIDITYNTKYLVSTIYDYIDENTLELEDEIISINGTVLPEMPIYTCGDTLTFEIIRDNEVQTIEVDVKNQDDVCRIGIIITSLTTIEQASREYTFVETNTGGPSGGLMQSLYIWNELTEKDYTHGLDIAGTGTIDLDGSVGPIGGVEQKIITSVLNGIDIFFVPTSNYEDALETLNTLHSDMILIEVETISDCIQYLEELGD